MSQLVLSLFPGIDLLGRGFEEEGFCVVRGPDLIFGGDIRAFNAPRGKFDGVIGGSPCPDFSRARRGVPPSGDGLAMLAEFERVVLQTEPLWWLLENVPACPNVILPGYSRQRIDLDARDCGLKQRRLRHFQYGCRDSAPLIVPRSVTRSSAGEATCMATEGTKTNRRNWSKFCELQGLPPDFDLPSFTLSARYRAVGNGVPPPMARMIARAILHPVLGVRVCACGCARPVMRNAVFAGASCRKRAQRARDAAATGEARSVTLAA